MSGTTQVFKDLAVNQAIELTEFLETVKPLNRDQVPLPKALP
jgi:hypothetical protein